MAPIRVFISYSHEDDAHNTNVLNLTARLREDGIDAWIDRYEPHPPQGWPRWMEQQIEQADHILLVCTDTYCRRFAGKEEKGTGLGATWEGLLARQVLYDAGTHNEKLIPIQFTEKPDDIPAVLRPYDRYILKRDYAGLHRHLTGQPEVVPPPVNSSALPNADAKCSGVPSAPWDQPIFFPGMPITDKASFFGRQRELGVIRHSLSHYQPIQIIGEQRMGKTSLLNRIDYDDMLPQRPKVKLSGQSEAGNSPHQFIRAIAEGLGKLDSFHSAVTNHATPDEQELLHAIGDFGPFTLMLDEADELTRASHGFTDNILNQCRALCESGQICWISASRKNLHGAFQQTGLSSDFLNNSRTVHVGQLDDDAAKALLSVLGDKATAHIMSHAAGFAHGLQWMADECWRRTPDCTDDHLTDCFANAMDAIFNNWWSHRTEMEQSLLRQATTPIAVKDCIPGDRRKLRCLVDLGLVFEHDGYFDLPGAAWKEYVRDAG